MKYLFAAMLTVIILVVLLAAVVYAARSIYWRLHNRNLKWEVNYEERDTHTEIWIQKGDRVQPIAKLKRSNDDYMDNYLRAFDIAQTKCEEYNSLGRLKW